MATSVVLSKPITIDGRSSDRLALDFSKLTGADVIYCATEASIERGGRPTAVLKLDVLFQAQLASRASGAPVDVLKALPVGDYLAVCEAVQDFLFSPT